MEAKEAYEVLSAAYDSLQRVWEGHCPVCAAEPLSVEGGWATCECGHRWVYIDPADVQRIAEREQ